MSPVSATASSVKRTGWGPMMWTWTEGNALARMQCSMVGLM